MRHLRGNCQSTKENTCGSVRSNWAFANLLGSHIDYKNQVTSIFKWIDTLHSTKLPTPSPTVDITMPSFRTLLLPIGFALAATATDITCPKDWLSNTFKDTKCCYGNMLIINTDAFCCVYDMTPPTVTSSASSDSTTTIEFNSWATTDECVTKVPFSASNYSDLVSSASSKIAASRATVATNEASSTSTHSSSASSGSSASTSGASSHASLGTAAATSNAAMPIATAQDMVLGGAAVVVGLFVL